MIPIHPSLTCRAYLGAFAVVEKCEYIPQNQIVAVKRLKAAVLCNNKDVEGMMKEVALLRKLDNRCGVRASILTNFNTVVTFPFENETGGCL